MSSRTAFTRRRRFLSGALAILAATSLIGVYAAFTESISTQTQNITTGSGSLVLTAGSLRTTLTSSVSDLVPGDWVTRPVTITNQANYDMSAVSLSVGDSFPGAAFTSDPEGLKLTVEEESTPGSGSWSTIYGPSAPTGNVIANIGGGVLTAGGSTSLRVTQTFVGPNTSKSLKGAEADLTYVFNGTQRACQGCRPAYSTVALADSPTLYFPMDTTADFVDSVSGYSVHNYSSDSTLVSGYAYGSTHAVTDPSAFSTITNPLPDTSADSVEFWMNVSPSYTSTQDIAQIVTNDNSGLHQNMFDIQANSTTMFFLAGTDNTHFMTIARPAGGIHQFTETVDSSGAKIYMDGNLVGSHSTGGTGLSSADAYWSISGQNLDEVAIYPYALSSSQVTAHYTAGK